MTPSNQLLFNSLSPQLINQSPNSMTMAFFTTHTTPQASNSQFSFPATMAISNPLCLPSMTFLTREFQPWKRRRFKPKLLSLSTRRTRSWKVKFRVPDFSSNSRVSDVGEWVLFTSSTPFNRFIRSRCPSIETDVGSIDELVKQGRDYVNVDSGKIQVKNVEDRRHEEVEYQRVCVGAKDGGVISLDWPQNFDLIEERGLDTTVVLIPGTAEGSMDANVRSFVSECLKWGLFPVVVNPRGCARSPLTTARLFTAADSDDVCSAIQFITRARPWSVIMGVGWGYGANMLTKYLAEAGEKTPLTAATCIDNPFDLDVATRTSTYSRTINKKLTGGLIDILKSNKSDEGAVPLICIPREPIAENPFTSLLLSSCLPSNVTEVSWCQQVMIEWLTAVELGLLKGHHPLLQGTDANNKRLKSLVLVEGRTSYKNSRFDGILSQHEMDSSDEYVDCVRETSEASDSDSSIFLNSIQIPQRKTEPNDHVKNSDDFPEICSSISVGYNLTSSGTSEVLQTEQVIDMLDVTMPGTLKEEDKSKVLAAVCEGETLIKALLDAVPEDIHGKLSTSVSNFLHGQGNNEIGSVSSDLKSKSEEHNYRNSWVKAETNNHALDKKVCANGPRDSSDKSPAITDKVSEDVTGAQPHETSMKTSGLLESMAYNNLINDTDMAKGSTYPQNPCEKLDDGFPSEEVGQLSEHDMASPKIPASEEPEQSDRFQEAKTDQPAINESQMNLNEGNSQGLSQDQIGTGSLAVTRLDSNEAPAPPISEGHLSEQADNHNRNKDEKLELPLPDQNSASDSRNPTFNIAQALDALTGSDGSTQVAFNSFLEVIESMITHLEESGNESSIKNGNENSGAVNSVTENASTDIKVQIMKPKDAKGDDQEDGSPLDTESVIGRGSNTNVENIRKESIMVNKLPNNTDRLPNIKSLWFSIVENAYKGTLYKGYLWEYILSNGRKVRLLILDMTSSLLLDCNPEAGQWLLLDEPEDIDDVLSHSGKGKIKSSTHIAKTNFSDNIVEPLYVILDSKRNEPEEDFELKGKLNDSLMNHYMDKLKCSVKTNVLGSLKVQLSCRLSPTELKSMEIYLAADMIKVANAVYSSIQLCHIIDPNTQEFRRVNVSYLREVISRAVESTSYLKRVLPVVVIIGSSLGALKNCSGMDAPHDSIGAVPLVIDDVHQRAVKPIVRVSQEMIRPPSDRISYELVPATNSSKGGSSSSSSLDEDEDENAQSKAPRKDPVMVGAATASLGASALLASQEGFVGSDNQETSSCLSEEDRIKNEPGKSDELEHKWQTNVVTSLAEKAMSVAAPVVPVKEYGKVDQERLVTMLAAFAQRGGMLRLVGNFALLWGSLRGAVSLTDRLISFLRIAEQPLLHRILGFSCMVLVLWSPVLVPLFSTLFHIWATNTSSKVVDLACVLGLYAAVTVLIMQWGKRIRGHEYPLEHYGLNLMASRKIQDFFSGLVGGIMIVLSIHVVNSLLGFVNLSWPSNLGSSTIDIITKFIAQGKMLLLSVQAILTATGIAFVEELLFRSWLLEEIAADLGYHPGIILSGLAFSLSQRSLQAIPGLWLLSICLVGARIRKQGNLFIPIGLRTGILVSTFVLQKGGYLIYQPNFHYWISGTHPFQPFSGVVGFLFALLLAIALYPRQPEQSQKIGHEDIRQ